MKYDELCDAQWELVRVVNATAGHERDVALAQLEGFRKAVQLLCPDMHRRMLINADFRYLDAGVDRPMCCGVFLNQKCPTCGSTSPGDTNGDGDCIACARVRLLAGPVATIQSVTSLLLQKVTHGGAPLLSGIKVDVADNGVASVAGYRLPGDLSLLDDREVIQKMCDVLQEYAPCGVRFECWIANDEPR